VTQNRNLLQGQKWGQPFSQMNCYNLTRLLEILETHGITSAFLSNGRYGEYFSSTILFQKSKT
jgi:hypothetical protein